MSEEDRNTVPAPPPESTRPDNQRPTEIDVAASVIANLLDDRLGKFLEAQGKRDEEFRALVVDVLNEALKISDEVSKLKDSHADHERRLQALEAAARSSRDDGK